MKFLFDLLKIIPFVATWGGILFFWYKMSDAKIQNKALVEYKKYYEKKRSEFTWLDNYIKEKGNPSKDRSSLQGRSGTRMWATGAFIIVFFIAFLISRKIAGSMFPVESSRITDFPSYIIWLLNFELKTILAGAAGVFVSMMVTTWKLKEKDDNPGDFRAEPGLTLECPTCHCPHSWVLLDTQFVLEEEVRNREVTMRRSSGGLDHYSSKVNLSFKGTTVKNFKCLNCNATHRGEFDSTWTSAPTGEITVYDPPKEAFQDQSQRGWK